MAYRSQALENLLRHALPLEEEAEIVGFPGNTRQLECYLPLSSALRGGPRNQTQFSVASPGTRLKCRVLLVTNVSRSDNA